MPAKLTTKQFIAKAQAVHGLGTYDYSQVVYRESKDKVKVICPKHGIFEQSPNSHLVGRACPQCAGKSLTTALFISLAKMAHGEKYDYSQTIYVSSAQKVKIGCPQHGIFEQRPVSHKRGDGCPWCGGTGQLTTSHFIARAHAVHGDKYSYSETIYARNGARVNIVCPTHGLFHQTPHDHLAGKGCRQCGKELSIKKQTYTLEEFVARARAVHGETYSYSQVEYKHTDKNVIIKCPRHGLFNQTPTSHILGKQGCPACGRERTNAASRLDWIDRANGRQAILYFLRLFTKDEEFFKVGISYNLRRRYNSYDLNGYSYEILAQFTSADAARVYDWEQSILETFAHLRYTPTRPFGGASECFASCEEILSIFPL